MYTLNGFHNFNGFSSTASFFYFRAVIEKQVCNQTLSRFLIGLLQTPNIFW